MCPEYLSRAFLHGSEVEGNSRCRLSIYLTVAITVHQTYLLVPYVQKVKFFGNVLNTIEIELKFPGVHSDGDSRGTLKWRSSSVPLSKNYFEKGFSSV